jgi:hypothetical protein
VFVYGGTTSVSSAGVLHEDHQTAREGPLKIRTQQIEAFEAVNTPDFEDFMVEHLKGFSPLHSEALGEKGIRKLIRMGVERAKKHGFTRRGPVKFYIETMILLGCAFDADPQYPWTGKILGDATVSDQTERADLLHAKLIDFLDAVGGPNREYAKQALKRARKIPLEGLPVASSSFASEIVRRMRENHPEKVAYISEDALRGLIPRAKEEAQKYAVATDAGVCLFIGLMFTVGHGFASDPKYPWVANTLANTGITDPNACVERLYSKTMTYLDYALRHLERQ